MDAISAGDWSRADTLVRAAGRVTGEALQPAALVHLQFGRYREAAKLLSRVIDRDPGLELSRNYARNLAALAEHRPGVLETVEASPADESVYQLTEGVSGRWTIHQRLTDGRAVCLSRDGDPVRAMGESLKGVHEASAIGKGAVLYGLGDGYLLKALATTPPDLPFDARQTVYIVQPDARLLHVVLMMHDYAGATGPIEDPRFIWLIGEEWAERMLATMRAEPYLPPPTISVRQTPDAAAIDAGLATVAAALTDEQNTLTEQTERYYADLADDALAAMFSDAPPRRPRVLLLTTRYSTVLRHSTADTAAAFEQLGWDARTIVEPADHLTITSPAVKRAVAEHQPDLVLQIDHLRHEHPGFFPAKLPFACWIQDHLANLTDRRAGTAVGRRDFVLTGVPERYHRQFGYPRRQLLAVARPTRAIASPTRPRRDGDDLIYVSNWSRRPADVAATFVERQAAGPLRDLAAATCDATAAAYRRGESIATPWAMHRLVEQLNADRGDAVSDAGARRTLADLLFDHVNNAYYRMQGLAWAADAAEALGLSLAIYGKGWDGHERFSRYARGMIGYGEPLDEATRRARFCLSLEPYACFSHPRTLDALAAGGRVLVRDHPFHHGPVKLAAWVTEHPGEPADEQLIAACEPLRYIGDIEAVVRDWMAAGLLTGDAPPLPKLARVSFDSARSLRELLETADEDLERIAAAQREAVTARLSYPAVMRGVVRRIGDLLSDEPGANGAAMR